MENTEIPVITPDPLNDLAVNPDIKNYLSETARWAKFMGIVGYVFVGMLVVGAFFIGAFMNFITRNAPNADPESPFNSAAFSIAMGAYFLVIALIYYFPSRYLHQFGVNTQQALRRNEQFSFTQAFSRLKSFFKFFGVLTLIVLVMYGLGLVFLIVMGVFIGRGSA